MTIMQVGIVAYLGVDKYSGKKWETIAERFCGNSSLSEGLIWARAKWSFSQFQTIVKMKPTEHALRDEEVGFGITSFGVVVKKI